MPSFRPVYNFSPQYRNVAALWNLYAPLDNSIAVPQLKPQELLPIVVFTAFSIEAYINSLGSRKIEFWDNIEKLPWRKKIEILHKVAHKDPEWGKGPLQFAKNIFSLRDKLAHGKPEEILGPEFRTKEEAQYFAVDDEVYPPWFEGITSDWAEQTRQDFRELTAYLAEMFGYSPTDYMKAYSVRVIEE